MLWAAAVVLLAAVVAYPLTTPVGYRRLLFLVAGLGVGALAVAVLVRWPRAIGWGLGVLTLNYGFVLVERTGIDPAAPLFAAALILLGEVTLAIAEGRFESPTANLHLRRDLVRGSIFALGAAGAAAVVLAVADAVEGRLIEVQIIGLAAAGVCLSVVVVLVQRRLAESQETFPQHTVPEPVTPE